jgi:hypothetical protein
MGCTSCKKRKVITELPPVISVEYIPDVNDIKTAFAELTSYSGVKEDKKAFISKVYEAIFKEELVYDCNSCVSVQARKFNNYITNELKLTV